MALSSLPRPDRTLIRAIACSCGRHTLWRGHCGEVMYGPVLGERGHPATQSLGPVREKAGAESVTVSVLSTVFAVTFTDPKRLRCDFLRPGGLAMGRRPEKTCPLD